MIFLNPIVVSKKIQHENSLLKAKSFAASLAVHGTLLASALYLAAFKSATLPEEIPVMISLSDYAPSSVDMPVDVSAPSAPAPIVHPATLQNAPTPQEKSSLTPAVSPEAFTPQSSPVRPSVAPSQLSPTTGDSPHSDHQIVANDSPKITPSALMNELPNTSNNEFNGATLGRIRAMIEDALTYPSIARKLGIEGVVVVSFILKQDGLVEKAEILTTSGSTLLDTKAIQTVLSLSGDYPPLNKTVYLKIPIAFSLKKS
jgi:periplasmic protein TonB